MALTGPRDEEADETRGPDISMHGQEGYDT